MWCFASGTFATSDGLGGSLAVTPPKAIQNYFSVGTQTFYGRVCLKETTKT